MKLHNTIVYKTCSPFWYQNCHGNEKVSHFLANEFLFCVLDMLWKGMSETNFLKMRSKFGLRFTLLSGRMSQELCTFIGLNILSPIAIKKTNELDFRYS